MNTQVNTSDFRTYREDLIKAVADAVAQIIAAGEGVTVSFGSYRRLASDPSRVRAEVTFRRVSDEEGA